MNVAWSLSHSAQNKTSFASSRLYCCGLCQRRLSAANPQSYNFNPCKQPRESNSETHSDKETNIIQFTNEHGVCLHGAVYIYIYGSIECTASTWHTARWIQLGLTRRPENPVMYSEYTFAECTHQWRGSCEYTDVYVGIVVLPARIIKLAVEMQFGLMAWAQS